jgi:hypothetical protein
MLIIGPIIGLIYAYKDKKIARRLQKKDERYLPYVNAIERTGGLLFFIAEENIDYKKEEIKSYVYNKDSAKWELRILPFPAVMYRKISTPKLINIMGNKLVNPYEFDKWGFYKLTRDHPYLSSYIPETTNIITKEKLDVLLNTYGEVFIKPTDESLGRGIFLITKETTKYTVRKNLENSTFYFSNREMNSFLSKHSTNHIFQQAIKLKSYGNRKIDYRVMAVRDRDNNWKCDAIMGWLGEFNGITIHSNKEVNGKSVEDMLKLQFNYNEEQIVKKVEEIKEIGKVLASFLDRLYGPYVDFGFDFGIDELGKVWIFEANVSQHLHCPLWINDTEMYRKVIEDIISFLNKIAMN